VTLHEPGAALTSNYLKVQLQQPEVPNSMVHCRISGVTCSGLAGDVIHRDAALATRPES
jgi:hypothetical protein